MGFRFRRSVKIAPGLKVNVGKRGASFSFGAKGAHVTVGNGRVTSSAGIPGTGLSYVTTSSKSRKTKGQVPKQPLSAEDYKKALQKQAKFRIPYLIVMLLYLVIIVLCFITKLFLGGLLSVVIFIIFTLLFMRAQKFADILEDLKGKSDP